MAFENYTQLPPLAPRGAWIAARVVVLAGTFALIGWLASGNTTALTVWWSLCVPMLPLLWFLAPGLWRNVCPMAFVNQLPRELGFTRGKSRPQILRTWAYPISLLLLIGGIVLRLCGLNASAVATAALLATALVAAFIGGLLFKGKSGWCGTFCPLAPVQKLYGQLPPFVVRNEYCAPCVGCQTNCYDFNPTAKLPSDLYDRDQWGAGQRRYFAGMYPGFVFGYFTFAQFGIAGLIGFPLLSIGLFETVYAFTRGTAYLFVVLWGMAALVTYSAFASHVFVHGMAAVFGVVVPPAAATAFVALLAAGALVALGASVRSEAAWKRLRAADDVVHLADGGAALRTQLAAAALPEVSERSSSRRFLAAPKATLLEALETAGLHIETGCRMGMCGADPVLVLEGADRLAAPSHEERSTLERLGLPRCRLACSAHVLGPVAIDIDAKVASQEGRASIDEPDVVPRKEPSRRVVIIGNGAAGVSAAEHLRRNDPDAQITVVSAEEHHFYNRMGIGRLVHGKSGLTDLLLLDPQWYEEQRIDVWLNTQAAAIDRSARVVHLATGDTLPYDALVLATGATARPAPCPGADLAGSFVLRTASDAMQLRHWEQVHRATRAAVIGGGVLGVEAAEALRLLGLSTTLLAREPRLMDRALDAEASALLARALESSGINVRCSSGVTSILGNDAGRVRGVALDDGTDVPCDLVVTCIGIVPNTGLAREAGLTVNRGIVVDASMRTSDPAIFAVGDAAELPGATTGLWPIGKKQGEIAAATITGAGTAYAEEHIIMHVKLGSLDVRCFGDVNAGGEEHRHITGTSDPASRWRRVVVRDGTIVAGVFVGESEIARDVARTLLGDLEHGAVLAQLQADDWASSSATSIRGEAAVQAKRAAESVAPHR